MTNYTKTKKLNVDNLAHDKINKPIPQHTFKILQMCKGYGFCQRIQVPKINITNA